MMQLARGAAASAKGDRTGNQAALNRPLHQNRAVPVPVVISVPVSRGPIRTDGPFRAQVSSESGLYGGEPAQAMRAPHSRDCRGQAFGIAAGEAGSSGRLVTLQATGLVRNRYCRSGETTLRIPFSRMNEALRRLHRLGARTLAVNVSGQDPIGSTPNG
jgi:phycocyanin-associated rod linker protein/phycoerythrin-associated linker protein